MNETTHLIIFFRVDVFFFKLAVVPILPPPLTPAPWLDDILGLSFLLTADGGSNCGTNFFFIVDLAANEEVVDILDAELYPRVFLFCVADPGVCEAEPPLLLLVMSGP